MRLYTSLLCLSALHLGIIYTLLTLRISATCFYPNGTADDSGTSAPCKPDGHSMCCRLNSTDSDNDTCNSDGFCIPSDNNGIWRGYCTDQTWKDPACINLCTTGTNVDDDTSMNANGAVPLTTCGDRSLCCGGIDQINGRDCCKKRRGVYLVDGKLISTTPPASTATSTSTNASPQSSSSSPPAAPSQTSSASSNNTGAIVGGVVGGVAGVVFIALAFWYLMIRRNLRQRQQQPGRKYEPYQTDKGQAWQSPREAPANESGRGIGELDTQLRTQELEGWHGSTG